MGNDDDREHVQDREDAWAELDALDAAYVATAKDADTRAGMREACLVTQRIARALEDQMIMLRTPCGTHECTCHENTAEATPKQLLELANALAALVACAGVAATTMLLDAAKRAAEVGLIPVTVSATVRKTSKNKTSNRNRKGAN